MFIENPLLTAVLTGSSEGAEKSGAKAKLLVFPNPQHAQKRGRTLYE